MGGRAVSGIVGIYNLDDRPVERDKLVRMVATSRHRGPDGSGIWVDGPVGLGHTVLHVSQGRYP